MIKEESTIYFHNRIFSPSLTIFCVGGTITSVFSYHKAHSNELFIFQYILKFCGYQNRLADMVHIRTQPAKNENTSTCKFLVQVVNHFEAYRDRQTNQRQRQNYLNFLKHILPDDVGSPVAPSMCYIFSQQIMFTFFLNRSYKRSTRLNYGHFKKKN